MQTQAPDDWVETFPLENTKETRSHTQIVSTNGHRTHIINHTTHCANYNKSKSKCSTNKGQPNEWNSLCIILSTDLDKCLGLELKRTLKSTRPDLLKFTGKWMRTKNSIEDEFHITAIGVSIFSLEQDEKSCKKEKSITI